jgi:hypothetical protein
MMTLIYHGLRARWIDLSQTGLISITTGDGTDKITSRQWETRAPGVKSWGAEWFCADAGKAGLTRLSKNAIKREQKNGASGRDPALHGSCKCSHISQYAALSKSPCALADGPMLVFQLPF